MEKIKKDFMGKELGRLALCALGFALCLFVLWQTYAKLASYLPVLLLGMAAVLGLGFLRCVLCARAATGALTEEDIYLLEKEYAVPHPVHKVWQGEIHLMPHFIVCRSRGRLLFIPMHKIERAERRFSHAGMQKIPLIKFFMDTDQTITIDFSPRHPKEAEAVFGWLTAHLGKENVTHESGLPL